VRTANGRHVKCSGFVALAAALLLALALPAAAGASVNVWFLQNGKPVSVARGGTTIRAAVEGLLAGPSAWDRGRGITTAVPGSTPLRSVTVQQRIVTVDLGGRFAAGRDTRALQERVGQLVRTLRDIPGVRAVKVLVDGGTPVGLFPGYDLRHPITAAVDLAAPAQATTRTIQQELVDLGFMDRSGLTGSVDMQTSTAVLGFQKWIGLPRDGSLDPQVIAALDRATRPEPKLRKPGRRVEIQLRRQLALLIEDNRVIRAVHISSGAYGKTPTGSFRVYRKERYSWSVPFKVWLPWASYFTGGVAFHEFGSVPTYAASHGCVRVNHYDAQLLFGFAEVGTPVDVFDEASA
jgi:peptidoglycan hydrolase-like protein with peptidoglycan-binding domain